MLTVNCMLAGLSFRNAQYNSKLYSSSSALPFDKNRIVLHWIVEDGVHKGSYLSTNLNNLDLLAHREANVSLKTNGNRLETAQTNELLKVIGSTYAVNLETFVPDTSKPFDFSFYIKNLVFKKRGQTTQELTNSYFQGRGLDVPENVYPNPLTLINHGDFEVHTTRGFYYPLKQPSACKATADNNITVSCAFDSLELINTGKVDISRDSKGKRVKLYNLGAKLQGESFHITGAEDSTIWQVGEGLETMLSIKPLPGACVRAATSAINLSQILIPSHVRTLVVYCDRGEMAEKAASGLSVKYRHLTIVMGRPEKIYGDFNDAVQKKSLPSTPPVFEEKAITLSGIAGLDIETSSNGVELYQISDGTTTQITKERPDLTNLQPICHNGMFEYSYLHGSGLRVPDCTMIAEYVLTGKTFSLSDLCKKYGLFDYEAAFGSKKEMQLSDWSKDLTPEQLAYAATDAWVLTHLFSIQKKKLIEQELWRAYENIRNAQSAAVEMMQHGLPIDTEAFGSGIQNLTNDVLKKATNLADKAEGWFSIKDGKIKENRKKWQQSIKHLCSNYSQTSTGQIKTSRKAIESLIWNSKKYHPFRDRLLEYLADSSELRLRKAIFKFIAEDRLRTNLSICSTSTGRWKSFKPNLQNIKRDSPLKKYFKITNPQRTLVIGDYSQQEFRIMVALAGEKHVIDFINQGGDVHNRIVSLLFKKDIKDVSENERQSGKALNFGLIFGSSAKGLMQQALESYGVVWTEDEAAKLRRQWFEEHPAIHRWQCETLRETKQTGEVKTAIGTTRRFTHPSLGGRRNHYSGNAALNMPIQGLAANMLNAAVAYLKENLPASAFLCHAVHDEIIIECDITHQDMVRDTLYAAMLKSTDLCPNYPTHNVADIAIRNTWAKESKKTKNKDEVK